MARIEPYAMGDYLLVEPRDIEKDALKESTDIEKYMIQGPAFTIWDRDIAVMCGGIRIRPDGGGEAWLFCSNWVNTHIMIARLVRDFMTAIATDFNLSWLQVIANTKYPKTMRWLGWLGFTYDRAVPEYPHYQIYKRVLWA